MIDRKAFYTAGVAVVVLAGSLVVQGCDLQRIVKVDVPEGVQQSVPVGEEISLADSEYAWDQWSNWVEANSEAFSRNIEDAKSRVALIENLTAMGIGALGEVSNTFPGGALLFSGLTLLTGWFIKRPGEDKAVAKEKEDSYNAGIAKGKELAQAVKDSINVEESG
tara:strand:- start:285 stop:779 length:495 start_codon:yes stop_codon:yes gene_type:complete